MRRSPPPEVHKLGGASLADATAFVRAVEILKGRAGPKVVVVSAPAGVTDALLDVARRALVGDETAVEGAERLRARILAIAEELLPAGAARQEVVEAVSQSFGELVALARGLLSFRELTPRMSDHVVSRGERLSARMMTGILRASGTNARYVDAANVVMTDGRFGAASPDLPRTDRAARRVLKPLLAAGVTPVMPGFLGAAPDGAAGTSVVATLGRGGTDLSATLVGRALGAKAVFLWKDVPGLMTADPRVVPDARVIPQLNVREAAELAYYGAKVLHPRALIPLAGRRIPVFVRPFAAPTAPGTEISERRTLERHPVKALSAISGQAVLTVAGKGMLGVPGIAARTFAALSRMGASISLITQASSEHSICFTVPEAAARAARQALLEELADEIARGDIDGVEVEAGLATLAVVGLGMAGVPGIAARVFSALAEGGVNIVAIAQGSSELNISMVVAASDVAAAQRHIHDAFQLAKIGGGAAAARTGADVVLLGCGQIGRTAADLMARNGVSASLRVVGLVDRSGLVFDAAGLSARRLESLLSWKDRGRSLARAAGGRPATAFQAVELASSHALANPILVDVTAEDTTPILKQALAAGMDLVLANKRPLAGPRADADELKSLARKHGRRIRFEATVGAGLPILDTFAKLVESGDQVVRVEGCLSGTLGFLLSEVGRGRLFSEALREALRRGFTEPDPREDLSGADVGRKALILGRLLGYPGEPDSVVVESLVPASSRNATLKRFLAGLESLDQAWARRIAHARSRGGSLRYIATVTRRRVAVGLRVVGPSSPFTTLDGTDNLVAFTTRRYRSQPLVITGAGAGKDVTAGGVVNDVLALAASS